MRMHACRRAWIDLVAGSIERACVRARARAVDRRGQRWRKRQTPDAGRAARRACATPVITARRCAHASD